MEFVCFVPIKQNNTERQNHSYAQKASHSCKYPAWWKVMWLPSSWCIAKNVVLSLWGEGAHEKTPQTRVAWLRKVNQSSPVDPFAFALIKHHPSNHGWNSSSPSDAVSAILTIRHTLWNTQKTEKYSQDEWQKSQENTQVSQNLDWCGKSY